MKAINLLAISLIISGLGSVISCNKNADNSVKPADLKAISADFSGQSNDFAFDLWQRVNSQEQPQNNYFISPLSLHIALGMLLNGADGKTKTEIQNTLRLSDNSLANINQTYQNLMEYLPAADPNVAVKIANSVWYRQDFTVEKSFLDILSQSFKAKVSGEDFNNSATIGKINQWASDNTNGKITKVIDQITPDQMLFLLNALYFKGDWATPFDEKNTTDGNFYGLSGTKTVKMMNTTESVKYTKQGNVQAIELPYALGNYKMTILLPDADPNMTAKITADGIENLIKNISSASWKQFADTMQEQKIIIGLPKFTLQYEINLNTILQQMGMSTAFTDMADLSKISPPAGKLQVGFVKQNTYVSVDEKGTEAAAVTTVGITATAFPLYKEFICNRPFAFVISEQKSNTILFVGKIANP